MATVGKGSRGGSKPGERRGGRSKGTPNKLTGAVKDLILQALEKAGGVDYLVAQADANPGPFLTLVGKVLPLQLTGDGGGAIRIEQVIEDAETVERRLLSGIVAGTASGTPRLTQH